MKVDNEGVLRPNGWPEGGSLAYLGDVAQAILSSLGPHSPRNSLNVRDLMNSVGLFQHNLMN